MQSKLDAKTKTIDGLFEEKKKLMVEIKVLQEKMEFAKIVVETTKESSSPPIVAPEPKDQKLDYEQVKLNDSK